MKYFDWDRKKNERLQRERDISFEEIVIAIEERKILDIVEHPNKKRYPNQRVFVIDVNDYAYLVPFIEDEEKVFLKTIIPSRKATKKYLMKG
ncbi:MAG: BrnT family toxin [Candidatus Portnoybacteria bacterium]|nr:BrnT family toxin [Candidatus Portnoybacteria bacterium]